MFAVTEEDTCSGDPVLKWPAKSHLVHPETLAKRLDVSERTVRNWISSGRLASYKIGSVRRIDPDDVDEFLARHRREDPEK